MNNMKDNRPKERIVCAAYVMDDGVVISGVRHLSPDMRTTMKLIYGQKYHLRIPRDNKIGGFINQFGDYKTREEAWKIADASGQIVRQIETGSGLNPREADIGDEGILFSENLY